MPATPKVQLSWDAIFSRARHGNGHSLSVMSETNSRVISLTSRRSRGVKASTLAEGCHCRADAIASAHPHLSSPVPLPRFLPVLGTRIGRVSKGENLRDECTARKGRLIAGRMYAPPWNNADKFMVRRDTGRTPLTRMILLGGNRSILVCSSTSRRQTDNLQLNSPRSRDRFLLNHNCNFNWLKNYYMI